MANELQKKIEWFENRHAEQAKKVEEIENDRKLNRSSTAHKLLKEAKKEKLRLKDNIEWLKKIESQSQKN